MAFVPDTLLLGHHGTEGACRAEALAFQLAVPGRTRVVHLLVVPDFWAGMQGDDWLNNASTRDVFARYVEGLLEKDAADQVAALGARCAGAGLDYTSVVRFGDPTQCLLEAASGRAVSAVVIGPPRPRGVPGFRSGVDLTALVRGMRAPVFIASRV